MFIKLHAKHNVKRNGRDYDLVDILRCLTMYEYDCIISRYWLVTELAISSYLGDMWDKEAIEYMFGDSYKLVDNKTIIVTGEKLLERSAVIPQIESGLFLRIIDPDKPVVVNEDIHLYNGPKSFQGSNIDLEIRTEEFDSYEIISDDKDLIETLQHVFYDTQIS